MLMDDNEIEQEVPEVVIQEPSLRDQLSSALEEATQETEETEKVVKEKTEPKEVKSRDDSGKFAKQSKEIKTTVEPAPVDDTPLPKGYSKTVEDSWKTIPANIKSELIKRDQDYHKELTKHDEERMMGRQFKDVVNPYMAQIRAEGGDPIQAVQNFFNISHILRNGTPYQKAKILSDTAQQFGIDISQAQQNQPKVDPVINQLQQRTQQLERQLQNQQMTVQQQTQGKLVELVNTFASDTANYPHFSQVETEMMALLQGRMFKDEQPADRLKKVYDYAVHANPQTRSTLIKTATQQSIEEQRVAQKAKADAARKAGSSVKGKPGMLASTNQNIGGSLRTQLRSAMDEAREA